MSTPPPADHRPAPCTKGPAAAAAHMTAEALTQRPPLLTHPAARAKEGGRDAQCGAMLGTPHAARRTQLAARRSPLAARRSPHAARRSPH
eukprot:4002293-Prymnesium_polylepis.1